MQARARAMLAAGKGVDERRKMGIIDVVPRRGYPPLGGTGAGPPSDASPWVNNLGRPVAREWEERCDDRHPKDQSPAHC